MKCWNKFICKIFGHDHRYWKISNPTGENNFIIACYRCGHEIDRGWRYDIDDVKLKKVRGLYKITTPTKVGYLP